MYVEAMIPEESHTSNYYAMTMGWPAGYSGLQINGLSGENFDINFSVWDGINRDNMPVIPEYYRAYALATHDNPEGGYVSFTGEESGNPNLSLRAALENRRVGSNVGSFAA